MWADNKKNGIGTFYYHTGAVYEGHFVDDQRQGFGKITFMAGSAVEESYEGQWEADEWHGHGVYRYRKEEGEVCLCCCGLANTTATLCVRVLRRKCTLDFVLAICDHFCSDLCGACGAWLTMLLLALCFCSVLDSLTLHTHYAGTVYEGDWVHGVRDGHGKISFKDGSFYKGEMQKNQMWGHGIFVGESLCLLQELDLFLPSA